MLKHRSPNLVDNPFVLFFLLCIFSLFNFQAKGQEYYQIKRYVLSNTQQEMMMDDYLENALIPALHRAGIDDIGVFKPIEKNDTVPYIVVWIPFETLEHFELHDENLKLDEIYLKAGSEYINAFYTNAPYERIESVLVKSFSGMPKYQTPNHESPRSERVYELRSYQSSTEKLHEFKVEMFNEGGEANIFLNLGFQPLFFSKVISGAEMPNLIYMITFSNMKSHDEHWKAFSNSPDWEELKQIDKYKNTVSHIDKYMLYPTSYSDF